MVLIFSTVLGATVLVLIRMKDAMPASMVYVLKGSDIHALLY